jgi:putative transposase
MSLDDKMELVEQHRSAYGLNSCLQALGLSKGTWHYRQHRPDPTERDGVLKSQIRAIIEAHPGYGYRPIQAELETQTGYPVNGKRIRRVLRTYELGLARNLPKGTPHPVQQLIRQLGSSVNLVQGRPWAPLKAFATDFTELIYHQGHRKAQLMVLLDLGSRWAGG